MPAPKAHTRSYTISLRALTPNPPQHSAATSTTTITTHHKRPAHKPTKSTPNLVTMMMSTEPFPHLTGGPSVAAPAVECLPRHNRDLTLRRYLLLQEEHESIHRHLDTLSTTTASTTPSGHKRVDSAARRASMPQCDAAPRPRIHRRRGRGQAQTVDVAEHVDPMVASEEARLCAINEGIKRSLTELLNCETVRVDQAFRQWIMGRLLEVEKELRVGRRRRSCPSE